MSLFAIRHSLLATRYSLLAIRTLLPGKHEFRHFPFEVDRKQAECDSEGEGQNGPDLVLHFQTEGGRVKQPSDDGDAGVELRTKQQRHLVAEDIAEHAAGAAGYHAGDDHD